MHDEPTGAPDPRPPAPPAGRRRRAGRRRLLAVPLVAGCALAGALLTGVVPRPGQPPAAAGAPAASPDRHVPVAAPLPADRPTPGAGAAAAPIGSPPPAPPGGGPHVFSLLQDNGVSPVAYDPCRVVHYAIRPDGAPAGGEELVHAAVARISQATGLAFRYDGPTDEVPSPQRETYQPARYGDRWAPVLVAWQTEAEQPDLAGDVVGRGGSTAVSLGDGPRVYVTGTVSLDAGQFPEVLAAPDGATTAAGIVLHELAHVVGLAHVEDAGQLLHPETVPGVTDLAAGDLTGLARLGRGQCVPGL
ncbi:peptidase [Geodermatophilus pulveris]|uniref:peptidase n=1 Tax=Geodermatophilus pulveris TaxID=1564159 RepID=UPI0015C58A34|nr:peptidase [Geodermatophilus pulveris]